MDQKSITILMCALGGEGGGVLCGWLVDAARKAGYAAQATSIPGVAQRTGATTYYLEVFPQPLAELGATRPVFSLAPVPGGLDLLVSSELLETVRQIGNGMSDPGRTRVVSSSARTLTTTERMQLGDGRLDGERLAAIVREFSREHQLFDMAAITREAGTVVSAVMLGAVAASGVLPFARSIYEEVVREGGRGAEASLRGFAKAYELVATARERSGFVQAVLDGAAPRRESAPASPPEAAVRFPAPARDMVALGYARVLEYQDKRYADLYLQRLSAVLDAERAADPAGAAGFSTTRETARWLALWMAFDDVVRVAALKAAATRWERVRQEAKAGEDDLLKVYDHFKPGVPEFAGLLPAGLARRLLQWDRRRQQDGKEPFSFKLVIGTHTLFGMAALRAMAALKWLRPRGQRFAEEQTLIERWLAGVAGLTRRDWRLGHEIALCGRLIKGYGSTNERGKENLLHVLEQLGGEHPFESDAARARAIATAREAALADDAGKALDQALAAHGAAPREIKAQPIRFVRRPQEPRKAA